MLSPCASLTRPRAQSRIRRWNTWRSSTPMTKKTNSTRLTPTPTTATTSSPSPSPSSSLAALPAAAPWFESELGERVAREKLVSSSSWATAYKYETESGKAFFVKTSLGRGDAMFRTEAAGLEALSAASSLSSSSSSSGSSSSNGGDSTPRLVVPRPLHAGPLPGGKGSFIVMEHLDLGGGRGRGGRPSQEELGVALAKFHLAPPPRETAPEAAAGNFGFGVDNFIGGTPQPNGWSDSWVDFFREKRLEHMLSLVGRPGSNVDRLGRVLCANLDSLFEDDVRGGEFEIKPSLIHGDLWSGNIATVTDEKTGEAAWSILDPAPYYGHHEAEFGMSWCAGFGPAFWKGYRSVLPEAPGFARRRKLYELYHILNHAVLFGGGYLGQAEALLRDLTRGM